MHTIKHILKGYSGFIWALLKPLGGWGVLVIAAVDASLLGMPLDAVVAGYVYANPHRFLFYVLIASAGSALGSIVIYLIGYSGGEMVLEKRISKARFAKIRSSFDRHEFWALMFPAMLPPPTPFKLFVLAAAVFEMNFWHFLLAIFAGRFVRFTILSLLTIKFGPQVVNVVAGLVHDRRAVTAGVVIGLVVLGVWIWRARRNPLPGAVREEK